MVLVIDFVVLCTEAEDIKKRLQEYTEELRYKKVLMTWITMMVWSLT